MNLTQDEITALKNTKSVEEWNKICDQIKAKRNGQYPSDWFSVVVQGGIMNERAGAWDDPGAGNITITTF